MAHPIRTFQHTVLETGNKPSPAGFAADTAAAIEPRKSFPIGTLQVNVRKVLKDMQAGLPIHVPGQFGDMQAVVTDTWLKSGVDFDGDKKTKEGILLRTIDIPQHGARPRNIALLLAVPFADDGTVNPDMFKASSLVDASYDAGSLVLIGGITLKTDASSGTTGLLYTVYNPDTRKYERKLATPAGISAVNQPHSGGEGGTQQALPVGGNATTEAGDPQSGSPKKYPQPQAEGTQAPVIDHSRRLIYSMALCADSFRAAVDATTVVNRIHEGLAPEQALIEQSEAKVWSDILRPLYGEMSALSGNDTWKKDAAVRDPLALDLLNAFMVRADNDLRFSDADRSAGLARHTEIEERFNWRMKAFRWEGKYLNRGEVFKVLRAEKDGAKREALYRHFLTYYGDLYREKDHLFDSASFFNAMAAKYGLGNYADMVYRDRFGFDAKEFFALAQNYFKESETEAREYVAMLQQAQKSLDPSAGDTIHIQDVEFLDEMWAQKFGGVTNQPRLTAAQALDAVKAFYAEIGIDLGAAPWNGIVIDAAKRKDKQGALGEALAVDKDLSYIIMNLDAKGVSLDELETLIHEYLHGIHFQAAQKRANGYLVVKDLWGGPQDFPEGIATVMQNLINMPEVATRILGKYPGFTRQYIEARAKVKRVAEVWGRRRLFMIAMQEILLYRETRPDGTPWPLEERLEQWNKWAREVLFVEPPKGLVYGEWAAKPHLAGKDYYLYYGGYPAGSLRAEKVVEKYVKTGKPEEMLALRAPLLALLGKGSMITSDDIGKAGSQ